MAEYRVPTQQELDRLLYMQGMQGKSNQQIIDENLARGSTIQALPENFFQTASAGARRVGDYVNQAGNLQQIVNKLFPSNIGNTQANVQIPTSFNFAPKQAPTGEVLPAGLQTQSVPVASILQAIKPADVLGISGAERAYGDIGAGKAPQPFDVVDTLGVGAGMTAAGRLAAKGGMAAGRYIAPELGNMAEQYAAKTGLLQSVKPIDVAGTGLLQTAPKSDIGFYSAVEQAAMASPRKSGAGQAFLNDIMKGQDVRADEIKWMGLDDYLKGKQNVTKQEVQDYIANNRVNVKEVRLGESNFRNMSDNQLNSEYSRIRGYEPISDGERMSRDEIIYELEGMNRTESGNAKFSKYQLPGGENYRELILTMPRKSQALPEGFTVDAYSVNGKTMYGVYDSDGKRYGSGATKDAALKRFGELHQKDETFTSSHFPEQQNPLAHLRVNDRIDADGKKMLLIEEIQSDWHQKGRDIGYAKNVKDELNAIQKQMSELGNQRDPVTNRMVNEDQWFELGRKKDELIKQSQGVPDAPFKDTWYQLALKRAIQHAAENGYDRIGLTTGSQQAARFDLSKQVDNLLYSKNPDGTYRVSAQVQGRGQMIGEAIPEGKLSDYVGKEVAEKMSKGAGKKTEVAGKYDPVSMTSSKNYMTELSGGDLKIGGEGMKKYYDEIYPKFLDKYGKKWGAKVGETKIRTQSDKQALEDLDLLEQLGEDRSKFSSSGMTGVRYLDITPEMKAGVSKGQPLFTAVPAIPAAGLLAPQEQKRR